MLTFEVRLYFGSYQVIDDNLSWIEALRMAKSILCGIHRAFLDSLDVGFAPLQLPKVRIVKDEDHSWSSEDYNLFRELTQTLEMSEQDAARCVEQVRLERYYEGP